MSKFLDYPGLEHYNEKVQGQISQLGLYANNPEYISAYTDANNRFLCGIKPDGSIEWAKGIPQPIRDFVESKMSAYYEISDIEDRLELTLDQTNRIVAYRKPDGTKVENVGVETPKINLSEQGLSDLAAALKDAGFAGTMDWSEDASVQLPMPRTCAIINFAIPSQAETKSDDISTYMQYWDMGGNYFKKPIILNAQGDSSLSYHIKNQGFDLDDGSTIKFGSWIPCDSFHIKKYFIDVFRGQCIVGYKLMEQFYKSRPYGEQRPWDYLNASSSVSDSNGKFKKDFPTGAMAHPDGFPVHLFFDGNDAGIYAFCLKKDRANYYCKKNDQNNIILDGALGDVFWTANGDMSVHDYVTSANLWEDFEIRNPKIATDIDGNKYDGDHPKEPSNDYATTKSAVIRLTTALTAVAAESTPTAKKSKFEEFFNIPFLIDYDIIGNVLFHEDGYRKNWIWLSNDGLLWSPTLYDVDSIFGQLWDGASYISDSDTRILGASSQLPSGVLKSLYLTEMSARYKDLRDAGIISVENIIRLLTEWLEAIGYDNHKKDIEDICTSPYLENGVVVVDGNGNPVLVPNTPSYRDGSKTYQYSPTTGGWYNSVLRVRNWLTARIATLDTYFNY